MVQLNTVHTFKVTFEHGGETVRTTFDSTMIVGVAVWYRKSPKFEDRRDGACHLCSQSEPLTHSYRSRPSKQYSYPGRKHPVVCQRNFCGMLRSATSSAAYC